MKTRFLLFFAVLLSTAMQAQTVGDVIRESADHTILEVALDTSGLFAALDDPDASLTVFAPTDAAFGAIDQSVIAQLLSDPTGQLTQILLYHVVGSQINAGDISDGATAISLQGKSLNFNTAVGVNVENARITVTDLPASNGVVHVIDVVLLPTRTSVFDIVADSDDHTTLEAALLQESFNGVLAGDGIFTVIAPTDAAFAALPAGALDGRLADVLRYHVALGEVRAEDIGLELIFPTTHGTTAAAATDADGVVTIDGVEVTIANLEADNGVVHVIDAAPIDPDLRFITDIVMESPDHNTLEAAFASLGINGSFSTPAADLTLFAPTDAAFAVLGQATIDALIADPAGLNAVLINHLAVPEQSGAELEQAGTVRAISNRKLNFDRDMDGNLTVNGAVISVSDLTTDNGVVHVVDAIVPESPFTILDIVELNSQVFSILGVALDTAGLTAVIDDPDAELTVFAPTDDAFQAVDQDSLLAYLGDPMGRLTEILTYHVAPGVVPADSIFNGSKLATVQGQDLNVTVGGGAAFVENAGLVQVNVFADNGVVHVIGSVLDPARLTVNEIIENSNVHETLEVAVGAAALNGVLSTDGPFTVFAPTDAAFDALPDGTVDALVADPAALTPILLYHTIIGGEVQSGDLSKGQIVETANGTAFVEITSDNRVFIDNAEVTIVDLQGDNGVVHVIDAVLLPTRETVVDVVINSDAHNTLETAVTLARLAGTLSGDGPFTVFAPTDDAFNAADPVTIQAALDDPDGLLTTVLTYHVVAGAVTSDMLSTGLVPTFQGESLDVVVDNGTVTVNGATVIQPDIEVDNGVVHVIDGVLLPPTLTNTAEVAYELVSIYPNPTTDILTVNAENVTGANYSILGSDGQVVQSGALDAAQTIIVAGLPAGTYTLAINSEEANLMAPFIKIQ
jgi:uncharacterized surface protein with fasciclin (FAS1) repeats